jgi:peroxiredoxin (alkyl hydroperoxide reductase subunit C)
MVFINDTAPNFSEDAFLNEDIQKVSLSDYKGKWLVLFFYPSDFSFICPTELRELAEKYKEIQALNCEVVSVSTDTVYVHKAWHESSDAIKKIRFPMLSDPSHRVCKSYGTLIENEGVTTRATFFISPDAIVKAFEFHDNDIGRNIDEIVRKIQAAKFVLEHKGQVCPMNWKPGDAAIKPGLKKSGKT